MTLRRKTALIVSATLFSLLVILYAVSRAIWLGGYEKLEEKSTLQNVERVKESMAARLETLSGKTGDWASWDETYDFVKTGDPGFVKRNLTDNAFQELDLNIMLYVDSFGHTVYGKAFDLERQEGVTFPQDLQKHIFPGSRLLRHTRPVSSITGIISLPEGPMLVASRPVLTSHGTGPIRGTLLFGRYLDAEAITSLAKETHLNLDVYRIGNPALPADVRLAASSLTKEKSSSSRPLSSGTVAGYALADDIFGKPALLVRVITGREIYNQGRESINYFMLSSLAIGVVLGIAVLILLERQVMARLTGLIHNVSTVGASGDLSKRVQRTGNDELTLLSDEINRMLGALERSGEDLRDSEEKFRGISATANDTIILMDDEGNISFWNKAAERTFGYAATEVLGKNLHDLLVPQKYLDAFKKGFDEFRLTGRGKIIGKPYEVTALRKDGTEFPVELSVSAVDLKGRWSAIGLLRDITRRKRAEEALRESEEKYRTLVENINIGVYRKAAGRAGGFLHANFAMARMFGYDSVEEFMQLDFAALFQSLEEMKILEDKIQGQGFVKGEELRLRRKGGSSMWGSVTARVHFAPDSSAEWIDGVVEDISGRKLLEDELRALSLRDELTGLYNRRGFLTLSEQQLRVANRVRKGMLLIFADLDGMKRINDTLGHSEGDRALIDIAHVLRKTFRESDIVARFGGDEFVVLSLETPESGAGVLKDRLNEHLNYHNRYEKRPYDLSLSIGMVRYDPENPVDLHDLVVRADSMMYEQKKAKKGEGVNT